MCMCPVTKFMLNHKKVEELAKAPLCPGPTAKMDEMEDSFQYSGALSKKEASPPTNSLTWPTSLHGMITLQCHPITLSALRGLSS